jgi:hypothetical protein
MFGCWAYYVGDRLVWLSAARRDPWCGILVPMERAHHAWLRQRLPALRVHPVIGKWLYLPARDTAFETVADELAVLIADGDVRIGVLPETQARRRRPRSNRKERLT